MLWLQFSSTTHRTPSAPTREEAMGSGGVPAQSSACERGTGAHTDSTSVDPAGWEVGENSSVYPGWASSQQPVSASRDATRTSSGRWERRLPLPLEERDHSQGGRSCSPFIPFILPSVCWSG